MRRQGFVEIAGCGLRYAVEGTRGPLVVMVHEMGGSLESWDRISLGDNHQVLRFDMRGCGMSGKISGIADLDRMTDDLAELIAVLDLRGPAHVCGMAVGGAIATHFAARYPALTASLAAMGPALGVSAERRHSVQARADRIERDGILAISVEELGLTYPEQLRDAVHFHSYRARWLGNDPRSYAATYRMLAALEMESELAAIRCPCLVLAGALDPLRPPALIEPVARRIAGARFMPIQSGHVMAAQTPDLVRYALLGFWSGLDGWT
jgi:pimeloyl-ACP methyl ester carboxylesterase